MATSISQRAHWLYCTVQLASHATTSGSSRTSPQSPPGSGLRGPSLSIRTLLAVNYQSYYYSYWYYCYYHDYYCCYYYDESFSPPYDRLSWQRARTERKRWADQNWRPHELLAIVSLKFRLLGALTLGCNLLILLSCLVFLRLILSCLFLLYLALPVLIWSQCASPHLI